MYEGAPYQVCQANNEDGSCSNGLPPFSYKGADHISYFGHHPEKYGTNGCIDPPNSAVTMIGNAILVGVLIVCVQTRLAFA